MTVKGVEYLFAEDWAKTTGGTLLRDREGRGFTIQVKGHEVVFLRENPFVRVDGRLQSFPLSPQIENGEPLLPIAILEDLFDLLLERDIRWDPSKRRMRVEGLPRNIRGIEFRGDLLKSEVVLSVDGPLRVETSTTDLGRLILRIEEGRMRTEEIRFTRGFGAIEKVEGEQLEHSCKILFHLKKGFQGDVQVDSNTILIVFTPSEGSAGKKGRRLDWIVLDPGHGGADPGAIGPSGVKEKEVALEIAKRLKKYLVEKIGVKVVMTREKDLFLSLSERARIANEAKADLFISIHCNASPKKKNSGGVETYFLSVAKTDWARAVEERENAALLLEEHPKETSITLQSILSDIAQNEFLNESSQLAEVVQEEIAQRVTIENRGISQAGFYVLSKNYRPAILVESAFLTHPKEERLLKQGKFQEKIAQGILEGVKRFKDLYEERLNQ